MPVLLDGWKGTSFLVSLTEFQPSLWTLHVGGALRGGRSLGAEDRSSARTPGGTEAAGPGSAEAIHVPQHNKFFLLIYYSSHYD